MGDEVFREILLPELPAYGNSIALFYQEYESLSLNMRLMKQYGVVSSWTNALSLTMTIEIVCLTRKKAHTEASWRHEEWQGCVGKGWGACVTGS